MISERRHEELLALLTALRRFGRLLMKAQKNYNEREAEVRRLHSQGVYNYSGDLATLIEKDHLLVGYSAAGKTLATLASGINAVIQGELAMDTLHRRRAQDRSNGRSRESTR